MPWRRSSSSNSRGSMRTECERIAISESFRPDRCRRRIDSATDRASVRESGAISTVTDLPPEPRVATSSGSASKSGSRRMKSVAQSRISWYDRRNIGEAVRGQQADEVELDAVGVLELVHEQVAESFATAGAKLGHALERV